MFYTVKRVLLMLRNVTWCAFQYVKHIWVNLNYVETMYGVRMEPFLLVYDKDTLPELMCEVKKFYKKVHTIQCKDYEKTFNTKL